MVATFKVRLIRTFLLIAQKPINFVPTFQKKKIYRSQEVLDIELAGYKIIRTLIEHFVEAVLHPEKIYSGNC